MIYHAHHFIFSFTFFFVYSISFLLHVKYTLSYRIVGAYVSFLSRVKAFIFLLFVSRCAFIEVRQRGPYFGGGQ